MKKEKAFLREKFVEFQLKISELKQELKAQEERCFEREKDAYRSYFDIFDALDLMNEKIFPRADKMEPASQKLIKTLQAMRKKMLRDLQEKDIEPVTFPENKIQPGYCRVVETRPDPEQPDDAIIKIVKPGYVDVNRDKVLRKADVIVVQNS